MSDSPDTAGKVISIKTRREVPSEAPSEAVPGEPLKDAPKIDQDTIDMAQEFLDKAKTGEFSAGIVLGWNAEKKCFFADLMLPSEEFPDLSAAMFIGQLELIKQNLLEIMQGETVWEGED